MKVIINGREIDAPDGCRISVVNDIVYINDQAQDYERKGDLKIKLEGGLASLTTDRSVEMKGDVSGNIKAGGSVQCQNVGGSILADGSVSAKNVTGDICADGSVNAGTVSGNVRAGGSIVCRK